VFATTCRRAALSTAEKLRRASPHWMRHTPIHALERGVDLTIVRDNLRHTSLSTTSTYLHSDESKRARQLREAFGGRRRCVSCPAKKIWLGLTSPWRNTQSRECRCARAAADGTRDAV